MLKRIGFALAIILCAPVIAHAQMGGGNILSPSNTKVPFLDVTGDVEIGGILDVLGVSTSTFAGTVETTRLNVETTNPQLNLFNTGVGGMRWSVSNNTDDITAAIQESNGSAIDSVWRVIRTGDIIDEVQFGNPSDPVEIEGSALTFNSSTIPVVNNESRIVLGGDFTAGLELVCQRIGAQVTCTGEDQLTHTSGTSATSNSGVVPGSFRPSGTFAASNVFAFTGVVIARAQINSSGTFSISYEDMTTGGAPTPRTDSITVPTLSFLVESAVP